MRIVFMGTPDYSVKTLSALKTAGHDIVAVFAQPDKPVGRKQILMPPPTKIFANENGIPVFQPQTLRDTETLDILKTLNPDVIVVVAYGKFLPSEILNLPRFGCINGHASLLPKLRGASPIQWAIVSGETETGISTMYMDEGMDTGDVIETVKTEIFDTETAEQLFERLADISANLMVSTLQKIENGSARPQKQDESAATYAPIIKKEMAHLDFTKSAKEVYNAVRGFYSWPCAYFFAFGKRVKVLSAAIADADKGDAGVLTERGERLFVRCGDGVLLELLTVKPEGKQEMSGSAFLNGNKNLIGTLAE